MLMPLPAGGTVDTREDRSLSRVGRVRMNRRAVLPRLASALYTDLAPPKARTSERSRLEVWELVAIRQEDIVAGALAARTRALGHEMQIAVAL